MNLRARYCACSILTAQYVDKRGVETLRHCILVTFHYHKKVTTLGGGKKKKKKEEEEKKMKWKKWRLVS